MKILRILAGYLLPVTWLLSCDVGVCDPQTDREAAQVVSGWLSMSPTQLGARLSPVLGTPAAFRATFGEILYYVIPLKPEGFVVVSADTDLEPIIAFSATGRFEAVPQNPLFALLQKDVPNRLRLAHEGVNSTSMASGQAQTKWTRLAQAGKRGSPKPQDQGNGKDTVDDLRVAPFIQSRWNQSTIWDGSADVACYNYYTPPYAAGTSSNYVCGCNNTAWAQIMRYFQYPTQPVGTASFTIEVDGVSTTRQLRGGDGNGGPYNWDQMPLIPGVGTTASGRQAIGALTADIATTAGTSYAADGSSAYLDIGTLKTVFHFGNAVDARGMGDQFLAQVNPNLDARLPVYFIVATNDSIFSTLSHAVVCDGYGYDAGGLYHHLNLGWGGSEDAWYNLPNVDTGWYAFTALIDCIYNIFTNGTGEIISGRVLAVNGAPVANATATATRVGGGTYTATTDTNGIYAIAGIPSGSQFVVTASTPGYLSWTTDCSTGTSSTGGSSGNTWGVDFILVPPNTSPLVVRQPADQTVALLGSAVFTILAGGDPVPAYQWQWEATGSTRWADLSDDATFVGSKTAVLTVNNVVLAMNGSWLRCVVSNAYGATTSSPPAQLTILPSPPSITAQPVSQFAMPGSNATFTLEAVGNPVPDFFQWQWEANGGTHWSNVQDGSTYSGAQASTLVVSAVTPAVTEGSFWCVISNSLGSATSAPVVLCIPYATITEAGLARSSGNTDGAGGAARFSDPIGVAVDSGGNVYVADTDNHTIRKVTPAGGVTTLAGLAGTSGSTDGTGSAARFRFPCGVAVDSAGNVYVADTDNDTIRKVTPAGGVTTLAGGGKGSTDGTGSAALFCFPSGVAVDRAGNVYVADTDNYAIRKVTPAGGVTTLAGGSGSVGSTDGTGRAAQFFNPWSVAVDNAGNVYVADTYNDSIRKLTAAGVVITFLGEPGSFGSTDGAGRLARFDGPQGVAVDQEGNVYVADSGNCTIRKASVVSPPEIQVQPQGQAVIAGQVATFTVVASGNPLPSYQWLKGGVPLVGATAMALTLTNVQAGDAANYSAVVTNPVGSITSSVAALTVVPVFTIGTRTFPISGGSTLGAAAYVSGSNVTVVATASQNYVFENWTENGTQVSTSATYTFVACSNLMLTANFLPLYAVSVAASPPGAGTTSGTGIYIGGTNIVVSAQANSNYVFVSWTENGLQVSSTPIYPFTACSNRVLVANFVALYTVSATPSLAAGGSVTGAGTFTNGSSITLSANANMDFHFVNWTETGAVACSSNRYTFRLTGNRNLVANFTTNPTCSITVSASPAGAGMAGGGGAFKTGSTRTVTAAPGKGYIFDNWTQNGVVVSTAASYTFVLSGSRSLVADFVPNPFVAVSGTYNGLFCDEANGSSLRGAGCVTVSTTSGGAFSGTLQAGGTRYALSGQFDPTGAASRTITRVNASSLTVDLQLDISSGTDQITGQVSDGTWTAQLSADRAVFDGKTRIAPQAGNYTLIIAGASGSTTDPGGDSYGTLQVSKAGMISFQGSLADGTKASETVPLSKNGRWPLYVSLYGGQGAIWSWLTFTNASELGGAVAWMNPGQNAKYYPAGFSLEAEAVGWRYYAPGKGTNVLGLTASTNLTLTLVGGGLAQGITNGITLAANGKVTPVSGPRLNLTFTPSTGAFSGNVVNPATAKPISFAGVVLQGGGIGCGFFLGTSGSGEVRLEP